MNRADALLAELTNEAATTRKHIARLPVEHFNWRPHPKSFTAGELAGHIVECLRWTAQIFDGEEVDVTPESYKLVRASSSEDLLQTFDTEVANARAAIARSPDTSATQTWRVTFNGKLMFEKPREEAFRNMTLNHIIHHRGQLTVYLRMLDIPLASTYGPTADEE